MLKYALIIALIPFSAQFAHSDDHPNATNDGATEQAPPRKDVYQKLGLTSGESISVPNDGSPEAGQPGREPAQEQPQPPQQAQPRQDDGNGNTAQPPRDTSDQPLTSQ
jgi:hypothetical protein